jgi:hypothetical protein
VILGEAPQERMGPCPDVVAGSIPQLRTEAVEMALDKGRPDEWPRWPGISSTRSDTDHPPNRTPLEHRHGRTTISTGRVA